MDPVQPVEQAPGQHPVAPGRGVSYLWMFPVLVVFALGVLGWGINLAVAWHDRSILAVGIVSVLVTLLAWFHNINAQAGREAHLARQEAQLAPINERLQHMSMLLNQVSEQQLISERAKAIAFRESERDAIRRAIREEIQRKDYDAALVLANDIESAFGYRVEADEFRREIADLRENEVRKAVNEALAVIDRQCRAEQWSWALREAERLMRMFPADAQAQRLPQDIEGRRQAHKRQLHDSLMDARARNDVDGSIEILRKLDPYLTPQEAEGLQDVARQVFKDRLQLLGQQFKVAVSEHRFADAIGVGQTIVTEFPNSRMAQEVSENMELLRKRATDVTPQEVARV